jgi:thiamine biosynthesis lipoprotein
MEILRDISFPPAKRRGGDEFRFRRVGCWFVLVGWAGLVTGCNRAPSPSQVKQSREVMGTLAEVTAVAADKTAAQAAVEAAYARLEDVNRLMSDYQSDSEIGRLNRLEANASLTVSPETMACLLRAREVSELSGGAFDVTCRPLIELWRTAARENRPPDDAALQAVRDRVGWRKLVLDESSRTVTPTVAGMQVDLGGIAKGYALDLAAEAMHKAGATAGLIDVGGDVLAFGTRIDGSAWQIGVKHPFQEGLFDRIAFTDRAVATSGVQQRYFTIDGRRYSHIIDPRTGRPAEQAPSVTVIAPDGITADAWATVFSVLSVEEGRRRARELEDVEVLWIWRDEEQVRTARTDGFMRYVLE